jgi:hypothetical protein
VSGNIQGPCETCWQNDTLKKHNHRTVNERVGHELCTTSTIAFEIEKVKEAEGHPDAISGGFNRRRSAFDRLPSSLEGSGTLDAAAPPLQRLQLLAPA